MAEPALQRTDKRRWTFSGGVRQASRMQRVVILGRGASGKSTLARALGRVTNLPVLEDAKLLVFRDARATEHFTEGSTKTDPHFLDTVCGLAYYYDSSMSSWRDSTCWTQRTDRSCER